MSNGSKNMDIFFEDRIKTSLYSGAPADFSDKVMQQIALEEKFAVEDKKDSRFVSVIIGAFSFLFVAFAVALGVMLTKKDPAIADTGEGVFSGFTYFIESISARSFEMFDFSLSTNFILIAFIIVLFTLLFSTADKFILKKRS